MKPRGTGKRNNCAGVQSQRRELEGSARLVIPGRFPGFNEILDAKASIGAWHKMKRTAMERVALYARAQGFPYVRSGYFLYTFFEPDNRRDTSNVVSGGVKIIEDALQAAGLLQGDGRKHVLDFVPKVRTDRDNPRVELIVLAPGKEESDAGKRDGNEGKAA